MNNRDRTRLAGFVLGISVTALAVLAGYAVAGDTQWSLWLQTAVNGAKLVELGALGFAAYQFWAGRAERRAAEAAAVVRARRDAIYQAWQVVNGAQGKGGSGGRVDALADLARHQVSLAGVNLDGAWLHGVDLRGATLVRASFENADLRGARLDGAQLEGVNFRGANLVTASLAGASLKSADLAGARLAAVDLTGADLTDVRGWREIAGFGHAQLEGVRSAPSGLVPWALAHGAVDAVSDRSPSDAGFAREFRTL